MRLAILALTHPETGPQGNCSGRRTVTNNPDFSLYPKLTYLTSVGGDHIALACGPAHKRI